MSGPEWMQLCESVCVCVSLSISFIPLSIYMYICEGGISRYSQNLLIMVGDDPAKSCCCHSRTGSLMQDGSHDAQVAILEPPKGPCAGRKLL